jgi:hypothetical protein
LLRRAANVELGHARGDPNGLGGSAIIIFELHLLLLWRVEDPYLVYWFALVTNLVALNVCVVEELKVLLVRVDQVVRVSVAKLPNVVREHLLVSLSNLTSVQHRILLREDDFSIF